MAMDERSLMRWRLGSWDSCRGGEQPNRGDVVVSHRQERRRQLQACTFPSETGRGRRRHARESGAHCESRRWPFERRGPAHYLSPCYLFKDMYQELKMNAYSSASCGFLKSYSKVIVIILSVLTYLHAKTYLNICDNVNLNKLFFLEESKQTCDTCFC
jgi:hypothetical protein